MIAAVSVFLEEIAVTQTPKRLGALVRVSALDLCRACSRANPATNCHDGNDDSSSARSQGLPALRNLLPHIPRRHLYVSLSPIDGQVLEAQGGKAIQPTDRAGLHPLLVPVCEVGTASGLSGTSMSGQVACLLRWPVPALHKVHGVMRLFV